MNSVNNNSLVFTFLRLLNDIAAIISRVKLKIIVYRRLYVNWNIFPMNGDTKVSKVMTSNAPNSLFIFVEDSCLKYCGINNKGKIPL